MPLIPKVRVFAKGSELTDFRWTLNFSSAWHANCRVESSPSTIGYIEFQNPREVVSNTNPDYLATRLCRLIGSARKFFSKFEIIEPYANLKGKEVDLFFRNFLSSPSIDELRTILNDPRTRENPGELGLALAASLGIKPNIIDSRRFGMLLGARFKAIVSSGESKNQREEGTDPNETATASTQPLLVAKSSRLDHLSATLVPGITTTELSLFDYRQPFAQALMETLTFLLSDTLVKESGSDRSIEEQFEIIPATILSFPYEEKPKDQDDPGLRYNWTLLVETTDEAIKILGHESPQKGKVGEIKLAGRLNILGGYKNSHDGDSFESSIGLTTCSVLGFHWSAINLHFHHG